MKYRVLWSAYGTEMTMFAETEEQGRMLAGCRLNILGANSVWMMGKGRVQFYTGCERVDCDE